MKTRNSNKSHVKKGDTVKLLVGNKEDRGQVGKVMEVFSVKNKFTGKEQKRAIVEGLKMVTKHSKPSQDNPQGSIVKKEAGIHLSNLAVVDPKTQEATRVGRKRDDNGRWVRYSKKSGEIIK